MKERFKKEVKEFQTLLKVIPATSMIFFVVSIVGMNIFANKELLSLPWLSLDCGFTMSWVAFLSMDTIVRRFGAKASIELSIFAELINLLFGGVFFLLSLVPENWGEFYSCEEEIVNQALNNTLGGAWYVVLGSTTAFIVSAVVNAIINQGLAKVVKSENYKGYAIRSFVSTFIGQLVDNLLFAYIVSINFFGWTHIQCWMCALTGAVCELSCEAAFGWLGYRTCKRWKEEGVGSVYLDLVKSNQPTI